MVAWSTPTVARLLRLLRRQGRHEAVQQGVAGRARPRRRSHGHDDGQRLRGGAEGIRGRHSGADVPEARADSRRREGAGRSPRRLLGAAARRVLRRRTRARGSSPIGDADGGAARRGGDGDGRAAPAKALGVTIEAQYTVGEYDILILSAQQSSGLETWLRENGYRIPAGASRRDRQLPETEHAVLRREGEPRRAGEARVLVSASAAGRLRVAEVHAADPPRHGERERRAGAVRLRADAQRPRRDDELPHRQAAGRHGPAGVPETAERVRELLQGDVRAAGREAERPRACSSSTRGT